MACVRADLRSGEGRCGGKGTITGLEGFDRTLQATNCYYGARRLPGHRSLASGLTGTTP